jgi:hypothetical protein
MAIWKTQILRGREFLRRLTLQCATCARIYYRIPRRGMRRRWQGVRVAGAWYCRPGCLQIAVAKILSETQAPSHRGSVPAHRIPLGLILLSRQQLTAEQLRAALEAQHHAGSGKIGEWLHQLGFATEPQITAALARQWSCPVLKRRLADSNAAHAAPIPISLLNFFQMIPVDFAENSPTLLMACSESVDHAALYAIEQMLGQRTEACFVSSSAMQRAMRGLAKNPRLRDLVFDRPEDIGHCADIVAGYAEKIAASEVRVARCDRHVWVRLGKNGKPPSDALNLVFRYPASEPPSGEPDAATAL